MTTTELLAGLHGKAIKGVLQKHTVFALDFTDGTSLWLTVNGDGHDEEIVVELKDEPV